MCALVCIYVLSIRDTQRDMYVVSYSSVDATKDNGRLGRLLNHSKTSANVVTKLFPINDHPYLCLMAARNIREEEELQYDYGERSPSVLLSHPWLSQWPLLTHSLLLLLLILNPFLLHTHYSLYMLYNSWTELYKTIFYNLLYYSHLSVIGGCFIFWGYKMYELYTG